MPHTTNSAATISRNGTRKVSVGATLLTNHIETAMIKTSTPGGTFSSRARLRVRGIPNRINQAWTVVPPRRFAKAAFVDALLAGAWRAIALSLITRAGTATLTLPNDRRVGVVKVLWLLFTIRFHCH